MRCLTPYKACRVEAPRKTELCLLVAAALGFSPQLHAREVELPTIAVVGEGERAMGKQPGSVSRLSKQDLELAQPASTQDALKAVPGIVVREEEGYGFIPNIGMRGLNPNRSQKLLVLEDGVPVAPGLFLANESYYSPRIERMESIEVLKGAAGLRYGPTTIGGVINYKTKKPEEGVKVTGKAGTHGYRLLGLDAGGVTSSGDAVGGISLVTAEGDGLRHNGFKMNDVVLKGGMALGDRQWLSAKLSYYDNDINTSYVGLRPSEYRNDPSKNPAPHDHFLTNRTSFDLNHEWDIRPDVKLQTVAYWSQLERDYWRREVAARTAEGTTFKPCDGSVNCMVGRNRSFEMMGADSRLFVNFDGFGIRNEAELGVRLHRDKLSNQTVSSKTDPDARTGTLTGDDSQEADSVAFYGQNRFLLTETVATTLGLRIESYDQKRRNELTQASGQSSNTEVMPGLGVTWQLSPQAQLFAGAYKAFSPAMVATAISSSGQDQELDAERSNNVEVGIRGTVNRWQYEATAFQMDFSNQIVPQSESGGVGATVTNAGKTLHRGVESAVGFDFGQGWRLNANATYVPTARYNSQKVVSGVDRQGNRLPYAPELVANLGVSYRQGAFQGSVFAHHTSQQYVDPENTRTESVDGRRGLIPAYTTFNLSANYTLSKQVKFFGTVRNLFDKKYIASRNPDGIFPGAERNVEVGMSYKF